MSQIKSNGNNFVTRATFLEFIQDGRSFQIHQNLMRYVRGKLLQCYLDSDANATPLKPNESLIFSMLNHSLRRAPCILLKSLETIMNFRVNSSANLHSRYPCHDMWKHLELFFVPSLYFFRSCVEMQKQKVKIFISPC